MFKIITKTCVRLLDKSRSIRQYSYLDPQNFQDSSRGVNSSKTINEIIQKNCYKIYLDVVIFECSHDIINEALVILAEDMNQGVRRAEGVIEDDGYGIGGQNSGRMFSRKFRARDFFRDQRWKERL